MVGQLVVFVLDVFEVLIDVLFFLLMIFENVSNGDVVCNFIVVDVDFIMLGYLYELILCGVLFWLIGNCIIVLCVLFDYEVMFFIIVQLIIVEIFIDLKFFKMFDIMIIDVNELFSSVMFDGKMKVSVFESLVIGYVFGRFVVED